MHNFQIPMYEFLSLGHWVHMAFPWQSQDVLKGPFGTRGLVFTIPKIGAHQTLGQTPTTWLDIMLKTTWNRSFAWKRKTKRLDTACLGRLDNIASSRKGTALKVRITMRARYRVTLRFQRSVDLPCPIYHPVRSLAMKINTTDKTNFLQYTIFDIKEKRSNIITPASLKTAQLHVFHRKVIWLDSTQFQFHNWAN